MEKKRQHRATSKEAHESIKDHKAAMYEKIIKGLERLRVGGTFQEIATASGLKDAQVWKRLPEMVEMGKVYNTGTTRSTSSGRKAMVRQLVGLNYTDGQIPVIEKPIKENRKIKQPVYNPLFD